MHLATGPAIVLCCAIVRHAVTRLSVHWHVCGRRESSPSAPTIQRAVGTVFESSTALDFLSPLASLQPLAVREIDAQRCRGGKNISLVHSVRSTSPVRTCSKGGWAQAIVMVHVQAHHPSLSASKAVARTLLHTTAKAPQLYLYCSREYIRTYDTPHSHRRETKPFGVGTRVRVSRHSWVKGVGHAVRTPLTRHRNLSTTNF